MSSGCVSWYLFNGFALVENSVVEFFSPTKTSVDLPWEEVLGLLNLHLADRNIYGWKDGVSQFHGFLEILQCLQPSHNSLGKHLALLGKPLLFNDLEDCNNMYEVFLVVPMGVDGHAEVGRIRKLDLEDLGFFLGHDGVYHRNVQNGRLMRQLPFLALSVFQPVQRLEGGTHFGVLPESGTQQEFLERRLRQNS